jgi:hypothetical protein
MGTAILDTCVGELGDRLVTGSSYSLGEPIVYTFNALSCVLGFLLPIRRLRERMASLG